jgi:transposase
MKIDGRKLSHAKLEEIRFKAVKAVQEGEPPTAVARTMGLYANRVFVWLAMYRAGGWDALRASKGTGRPKRLNGRQIQWIYNTITMKSPLQLKLPFALWTRSQIRTIIYREFRDPVESDFDWEAAGAARTDMSKAALSCLPAKSFFGGAMVEQGVSTHSGNG